MRRGRAEQKDALLSNTLQSPVDPCTINLTRVPLLAILDMPDAPTLTPAKKLILVIGATGAQGTHVIDKFLEPSEDGRPSPYAIRALTRDRTHRRALELAAKGVELVAGA